MSIAVLLAAACAMLPGRAEAQESSPSTYVIVPGMWSGGWDWRRVDSILTARGHRVYRVTLTGLGERAHLAAPTVGLDTHIADVANTIIWEELTDVVLVGHSYGGMVIAGVVDRVPERIRRLVYVEAFVPESGESVERLVGQGFKSLVAQNTRGGLIYAPWVPPDRGAPKEMPHPHRTFTDTLVLANPAARRVPASFILTVDKGAEESKDGFAPFAARAAARKWPVYRMQGDHTPARSAPEALVNLMTLAPAPAQEGSTFPADLTRAIEAFDRAQVNADTAALARLVADDYVLVNSDATVDRKAKYLADFLLPGLKMDPYVIEQRIEKAWGDAAILAGVQRLSWTQDGVRHRRVLRIVHVWQKRGGRWQATHTQLTRIPE